MLQQWAAGDFDADYDPQHQPPHEIDEVPVHQQAAMLDQASLEFCLADAFHPGCEMTWPMRTAGMYMAPFRLLHAPAGWVEPQYGAAMTPDVISLPNGPLLGGQLPGGITRWMAIPWQTDTASCRSGYVKDYDPYVQSFWPARVPNQVMTEENYKIVVDEKRPLGERLAAFANRASWLRPLGSKSYTDQINNLVKDIGQMGVVENREGVKNSPHFPPVMEVEQLPKRTHHLLAAAVAAGEHPEEADQVDVTGIEKVRRFPYGLRR
jgi:hypothetical protein